MYIYTCSLCFQVFYSHDGWFLARQAVLYTNRSIGVISISNANGGGAFSSVEHISFLRYTLKKINFLRSTQTKVTTCARCVVATRYSS